MRPLLLFLFLLAELLTPDVLCGQAFSFLRLPQSPLQAAAGGVQPGWQAGDPAASAMQPALYSREQDRRLSLSFSDHPSGTGYSLAGARHLEASGWTLGGALHFLNYGTIEATDLSGNITGTFRAADYLMQVSGARNYGPRWRYGFTLKYIHSAYAQYRASGVAADAGLHYSDTAAGFSFSVVARNMGTMLGTFFGEKENLPFDLQAGIHKKLPDAPLAFSIGVQGLHRFDLGYRDSLFALDNNLPVARTGPAKALRHLTAAAHIFLGSGVEGIIGYNHLRQQELSSGTGGAPGLSYGLRAHFRKLHILAARVPLPGRSGLQFGLNLQL